MRPKQRTPRKQIEREIVGDIAKRQAKQDIKERFVDLLLEGTDEARQVARDIALDQGVVHTGTVISEKMIGDSVEGPLYEVSVRRNGSTKRHWTRKPVAQGDTVDFTVKSGYPTMGWGRIPKGTPRTQMNSIGELFAMPFDETTIRWWMATWWR